MTVSLGITLLIIIIILALIFDYINGFHDAANSIATIVSTKVLTPFQAVVWAAFFNFVAYFIAKYVIGEFGIADTVAKTVDMENIAAAGKTAYLLPIILSGLVAAIIWNLLTWWLGIPSSSSHTLIGGFAGAAIVGCGFNAIHVGTILKIVSFIVLAPIIGMTISILLTIAIIHICKKSNPHKADLWFKRLQLVSSALFSVGHGLNDSQKVMGIIGAAIIAAGSLHVFEPGVFPESLSFLGLSKVHSINDIPAWVPLTCFTVIALGTMSGGWRIVKTMGSRITKVTPLEGVAAETAGAITLFITEILKIPVSTTHTITGAIIGVGAVKRLSAVRWGVTTSLLWAWVLTIPVSATMAGFIYWIFSLAFL